MKSNTTQIETKDVDMMPIWQNHENRITTLENTFSGFSHKMEEVDKKIDSFEKQSEKRWDAVEKKLDKNNDEQKELLNKLITHHLETKKIRINNFWQAVLNITGAGGILTAVVYALVQLIQYLTGN